MCAKLREHLLVCLWRHFKTLQSRQAETWGNCATGTGRNICMKRKKREKRMSVMLKSLKLKLIAGQQYIKL